MIRKKAARRTSTEQAASRTNRSQFVILGILSIRPASGYDIQKAIQSSTSFFWTESYGQIYPTLERLLEQGLVRARKDVGSGRRRTTYSITAEGRRAFDAWIRAPYQPTVERNELLLKVFFGRLAEPAVTAAHLRRARQEAEVYLHTLQGIAEQLKKLLPTRKERIHTAATVKLGIAAARAQMAWCDEVLSELEEEFGKRLLREK
ncbi:MAG: PadR family transcriptional regulator [Myxococcota bacterium]